MRPGVAFWNTAFLCDMYAGKLWCVHASLLRRRLLLDFFRRLGRDEAWLYSPEELSST